MCILNSNLPLLYPYDHCESSANLLKTIYWSVNPLMKLVQTAPRDGVIWVFRQSTTLWSNHNRLFISGAHWKEGLYGFPPTFKGTETKKVFWMMGWSKHILRSKTLFRRAKNCFGGPNIKIYIEEWMMNWRCSIQKEARVVERRDARSGLVEPPH